MDTLLKIVGFGGPAVLAVMGFVVIDRPPKGTRGRWIWYGAFSVVAAVSVTAAVLDARSTEHRLNEMLLGGDNYPYFFASYDPKKLGGNAQLILVSEKHTPLFDVAFSIHRAPTQGNVSTRNDRRC
jgi:hypothetical protein